jgi:hypothetical protein
MLQVVPFAQYAKEVFPGPGSDFDQLFKAHGREVRGRPFDLDFRRYHAIEFDKRLVWIVARVPQTRKPIGYACSHWYRDMNFYERVAADGLWYVDPAYRRSGVGKTVKVLCHEHLEKAGVVRIYDNIRAAYNHPNLMHDLGFVNWGHRWVKVL